MSLLVDHSWKLKYTPDDGDLVALLYVPALQCAVRYDRLTGFFGASALALAARGIEGLIRNNGRMRLIVGCTLDAPEIAAIEKGQNLREAVEQHLLALPLAPSDRAMANALELLAWIIAKGILEVRVAVPCDEQKRPISASGIFHEKAGIIEDKTGDRVAFNGSLNETAAGWRDNWESVNVFRSWEEPERVSEEETNFARIWAGRAQHLITLDVPSAVRENLMRFLPKDDSPARIGPRTPIEDSVQEPPELAPTPGELPALNGDLRRLVWAYIANAPTMPNGGERVGEATAAVKPWPHQVRAFERMYNNWPPKLLIADEVGLGKTIEAGLLLRQAWLARRAQRILIMAPRRVCSQWQLELREKFNLNWPIYDAQKQRLCWYDSPAMHGRNERPVSRTEWFNEPAVIVSSQLIRRRDRVADLEKALPWDLIVLDEAHHARRHGAGSSSESGPNSLLGLMHQLKSRTSGLILLSATPMQVHPVELWDLLNLLGIPAQWDVHSFLRFFDEIAAPNPSHDSFDWLARMFQHSERYYGRVSLDEVMRVGPTSRFQATKILDTLRDSATTPRKLLETAERQIAIKVMWIGSPVGRLVSRATRQTLRRYFKEGRISTPIADRHVDDHFIALSPAEADLYQDVEEYISKIYNRASQNERGAVGFVMTIYRRRLASSLYALRQTLEDHLAVISQERSELSLSQAEENADVDSTGDDALDADEAAGLEKAGLVLQEQAQVRVLIEQIKALPEDTKIGALQRTIAKLQGRGYAQVMVFTQFTDTMDYIREKLAHDGALRVMCFSGRGGEVRERDGSWRIIPRDDVKRRFKEKRADVLVCSDAAAEGLNFQFCGALINYDMPWNPMRVEQRIGRIDRLGQAYKQIEIVNLHYSDTVETDVYVALRKRIGLFETTVGRLQPILSQLPGLLSDSVLKGRARDAEGRARITSEIEIRATTSSVAGPDLNAIAEADAMDVSRHPPKLSLDDLDLVIRTPQLLPAGVEASGMDPREYAYRMPGMDAPVRVSTDPNYFEENSDSIELWSPGNPLMPTNEVDYYPETLLALASIRQIIMALEFDGL